MPVRSRSPATYRRRRGLELLEHRSYECFLTGQFEQSIEARQEALNRYRRLGATQEAGDSLRWLSRIFWWAGRPIEAGVAVREGVTLLEQQPPGRALAMAYAQVAQLCMSMDDQTGALDWGSRALDLAERLQDTESHAHALCTIGSVELTNGERGSEGEDLAKHRVGRRGGVRGACREGLHQSRPHLGSQSELRIGAPEHR